MMGGSIHLCIGKKALTEDLPPDWKHRRKGCGFARREAAQRITCIARSGDGRYDPAQQSFLAAREMATIKKPSAGKETIMHGGGVLASGGPADMHDARVRGGMN